jgi:hypothetical protein
MRNLGDFGRGVEMTFFNPFNSLRRYTFWIIAGCLIFTAVAAGAQTGKNARSGKLTPALINLQEQHSARAEQRTAAPLRAPNRLVRLAEDRVVIKAVAEDDAETLKADLEALGMQHAVVYGRIVSGELPVSSIGIAGDLRSLRFARESLAGRRAGAVTSQGDVSMVADVARTNFDVDGAGVKVGVLSDSFNCLGGAAGDVASGDLSAVSGVQDLTPGPQGQC